MFVAGSLIRVDGYHTRSDDTKVLLNLVIEPGQTVSRCGALGCSLCLCCPPSNQQCSWLLLSLPIALAVVCALTRSHSTAPALCLALLFLSRYGHHAGLPGTNIPSLLLAHSLAICWERSTLYTMTKCQATPMTPLYPRFRYILIVGFLL